MLLLVLAAISVIIVFLTLFAYYRSSLIHLSGTLDKDFFPAFGSFISGTVGLILSIASVILIYSTYQTQQEQLKITRDLVDRQISLSVKPDLVVEEFNSFNFKPQPQPIPLKNSNTDNEILPEALRDVKVRILNVGLEVARYIEYKFEYDANALIVYMDTHLQKPVLKLEDFGDKGLVKITHIDTQRAIAGDINFEKMKILKDYLMPYKLNSECLETPFPRTYLLFYYYMWFGTLKHASDGEKMPMEKFPPCYLNTSYSDLEGKIHKKQFLMNLLNIGWGFRFKSDKSTEKQISISITAKEMS